MQEHELVILVRIINREGDCSFADCDDCPLQLHCDNVLDNNNNVYNANRDKKSRLEAARELWDEIR